VADLVALPAPTSRVHDGEAEGEVMSVDRFGNVQLSIPAAEAGMLASLRDSGDPPTLP